MICEWGYICAKLWSNNCGAYSARPTPPLFEENVFPNTWMVLERRKLWSCVLTVPGTKNNFAGENQQQSTGLYRTNNLHRLDTQGFGVQVPVGVCFFFLISTPSRLVLGPTKPPVQLVQGLFQWGHEADHSSPSSTEVKKLPPPMSFMAQCLITKVHGQLYLDP
jgi:hypothetical protein